MARRGKGLSTRTRSGALTNAQKAFLDTIAETESRYGYDRSFGNVPIADLSRHPGLVSPYTNQSGARSSAAGRYQFLSDTWKEQAARLGLPDFSPESQDAAAWDLAANRYATITGRDLAADLATGDPGIIGNAGTVLNKTWTSFPGGREQAPGLTPDTFAQNFTDNVGFWSAADQAADPLAANHVPGASPDQRDRLEERQADIAARDSTLGDTIRGFLGAPITAAMRAADALRDSLTPSDAPVAGDTARRAGAGPGAPGEAVGAGTVGAVERGADLTSPADPGAFTPDPRSMSDKASLGHFAPTSSDFGPSMPAADYSFDDLGPGGLAPATAAPDLSAAPAGGTLGDALGRARESVGGLLPGELGGVRYADSNVDPGMLADPGDLSQLSPDSIGVDKNGKQTAAQRMHALLGTGPPDATGPVAAAAAAPSPSTAAQRLYAGLGLAPTAAAAPAERAIDRVTSALGLPSSAPATEPSFDPMGNVTAPAVSPTPAASVGPVGPRAPFGPGAPVGPAPGTVAPGKPGEAGYTPPAQSPLASLAPAALSLASLAGSASVAYGLGKAATSLGSLTAPQESAQPAPAAAPAPTKPAPVATKPAGLDQAPDLDTPYGAKPTPTPALPGTLASLTDVGKGAMKGASVGAVAGLPGMALGGAIGGFLGLGGDRINSLFGGPQPVANAPMATFADLVPNAAPGLLSAVNTAGYGRAPEGYSFGYSPFGAGAGLVSNNAPEHVQIAGSGPGLFGALGFGGQGYGPSKGSGGGGYHTDSKTGVTTGTGGLY